MTVAGDHIFLEVFVHMLEDQIQFILRQDVLQQTAERAVRRSRKKKREEMT
jgi:hypothetical protein